MQDVKLSEETLNTLATEIADKVCYRIGDALIQTGKAAMIVGLGLMIVGHIAVGRKRKNCCPWTWAT